MIIGIDGNEANIKHRVGSNIYAFAVLKQLSLIGGDNKYRIYLREKPLPDLPLENNHWKYRIFGPRKLWTQFALPVSLYLEKEKPDVFFTPGHYAPRFCPCPSVISVLDISYLLFPDYFKKQDLWQLRSWTKYSIRKAQKIITISKSSKKDIVKHYQISEDKIVVIYPGYNRQRFNSDFNYQKTEDVLKKYRIKTPYILYVGTIQPRKNLLRLISAFRDISSVDSSLKLVIAGKVGWLYDEVVKESRGKNDQNIIFTGYIEDNDLPGLYQNASCFVLPSLYEGFGIPVIEAMACGCPVIASNNSSLPEIVGDAGILIDPYSVEEIKNAILKVLALKPDEKESMIKKGREQANKFSWEKCGREILQQLTSY